MKTYGMKTHGMKTYAAPMKANSMKPLFLALACVLVSSASLASEPPHPKTIPWSFNGPLGTLDKPSAQRGYQVYKEVCSACHSLQRVAFRSLSEIGFSEGEIKALASATTVKDGPNDAGDMFDRPGKPSDPFPSPFANEEAARASNGGAFPPDLSLIIKARHDGANYVYSLLTGYEPPPADVKMAPGMHYNSYFPGGQIAMAQPLSDNQVTYQDGTVSSLDQEARDVVTFLQWAAEPEMEERKAMGIKVLLFLLVMTGFAYAAKKRVWRELE